jgi:hypothetical protein
MTSAAEVEAGYRLQMGWSFLQPYVVWRSAHLDEERFLHTELEIALATGWSSAYGSWHLLLGVETGLLVFFETPLRGSAPQGVLPVGFDGAVLVEVGRAVAESWTVAVYFRPNLTLFRDDSGIRISPAVAGGLAVSYAFR